MALIHTTGPFLNFPHLGQSDLGQLRKRKSSLPVVVPPFMGAPLVDVRFLGVPGLVLNGTLLKFPSQESLCEVHLEASVSETESQSS